MGEAEGGVLLLGDVDVVAGVGGRHDVAWARVQQDALVVLALHADQAHAAPAGRTIRAGGVTSGGDDYDPPPPAYL